MNQEAVHSVTGGDATSVSEPLSNRERELIEELSASLRGVWDIWIIGR